MNIRRERLWRFHKYRGDENFCPLCFSPVKWIYDISKGEWCPCDDKPIAYITADSGKKVDLYTRYKRPEKGILYNSWDKRFTPQNTKYGYIPHIFTCEELTKQE